MDYYASYKNSKDPSLLRKELDSVRPCTLSNDKFF